MCGIYGSTLLSAPDDRHVAALNTLVHRGPDQSGIWSDDHVFMGHRRLSIMDLSDSGRQPMATDAPPVVITVNGEIYNFQDLRRELQTKVRFRSNSDSEVVLHGYAYWGLNGLIRRLEGMYAIAIYDQSDGQIHLIRDRVGIKPLYYALHAGEFVWASELRAIATHFGPNSLSVDPTALYDFLTYLYVPAPKSVYRNVYKVCPAHVVTCNINDMSLRGRRYWELSPEATPISVSAATKTLRELLQESVSQQMMSDVDVGYFLSGGLDSSSVVAFSDPDSSNNRTYSIGFHEAAHNETEFARRVAVHCGLHHNEKILTEDAVLGLMDAFVDWFTEPFADTSAFPTYLVSEFARGDVKVVLTGDGGDEVFGGYDWYATFATAEKRSGNSISGHLFEGFLKRLPLRRASIAGRARNKFFRKACLEGLELYAALLGGLIHAEKHDYRARLDIPSDYDDYWHFRNHYKPELPILTRLQYLDFCTYLPDDILTKVDRVSMAVSLEARVPLLSTKLVEFAFSLPEEVRSAGGTQKGILKLAVCDLLPESILARSKKGFSVPERNWRTGFFEKRFTKQENILRVFNDRLNGPL